MHCGATKPTCCNYWRQCSAMKKATELRNLCTVTRESPLFTDTRESLRTAMKTQRSQNTNEQTTATNILKKEKITLLPSKHGVYFSRPLQSGCDHLLWFNLLCQRFISRRDEGRGSKSAHALEHAFTAGNLLSSQEGGWTSLLHVGRWVSVTQADIDIKPDSDMWRLPSLNSLPTARHVTEAILGHPSHWVSLAKNCPAGQ